MGKLVVISFVSGQLAIFSDYAGLSGGCKPLKYRGKSIFSLPEKCRLSL